MAQTDIFNGKMQQKSLRFLFLEIDYMRGKSLQSNRFERVCKQPSHPLSRKLSKRASLFAVENKRPYSVGANCVCPLILTTQKKEALPIEAKLPFFTIYLNKNRD